MERNISFLQFFLQTSFFVGLLLVDKTEKKIISACFLHMTSFVFLFLLHSFWCFRKGPWVPWTLGL